MLLDPLARIAALAKVIGQLRGIIISDMYHGVSPGRTGRMSERANDRTNERECVYIYATPGLLGDEDLIGVA